MPVVGVTLLHRKGYFEQHLDEDGNQTESPVDLEAGDSARAGRRARHRCTIEGRTVHIRAWKYPVRGVTGHEVPVYLLDTQLPENSECDRTLTDYLYGGDSHYRLCQEIVLGMGGAAMLTRARRPGAALPPERRTLGAAHAAVCSSGSSTAASPSSSTRATSRPCVAACVFTTHTPVPAGHDKFPLDMVRSVLGDEQSRCSRRRDCVDDGTLNLTHLALRLARFVNGVAMKHREVSQGMFPNFPIDAITNGVHAGDVDVAGVPAAVRQAHSRVAHRQSLPALRGRHSAARRFAPRTPKRRRR